MSFSNPVAKSVGADGTAPGRVWESRLLPALITSNIVVGGVSGVPCVRTRGHPTHPLFVFVLLHRVYAGAGVVCGVCCTGALGVVCGGYVVSLM